MVDTQWPKPNGQSTRRLVVPPAVVRQRRSVLSCIWCERRARYGCPQCGLMFCYSIRCKGSDALDSHPHRIQRITWRDRVVAWVRQRWGVL